MPMIPNCPTFCEANIVVKAHAQSFIDFFLYTVWIAGAIVVQLTGPRGRGVLLGFLGGSLRLDSVPWPWLFQSKKYYFPVFIFTETCLL